MVAEQVGKAARFTKRLIVSEFLRMRGVENVHEDVKEHVDQVQILSHL